MLNRQEIDEAIAELESGNTTMGTCSKLATLYTVRNHAFGGADNYRSLYSQAAAPAAETSTLDQYGDSDFLIAVSGKPAADCWRVIDDLMETLHVVNPRVYESVMRKMKQL